METKRKQSWFSRHRSSAAIAQNDQTASDEGAWGPLGLRLLYASPQPLIDIVFVHGLRGGSHKTWRKGNDPWLFWPQRWLPMEPDLYNASIHSFGYESDWGSKQRSILNIHDFGTALYEEMKSSPLLRDKSNRPIVLLGHSMGGLVIKKAFTLAHQDTPHSQLANRIRCIFFLATPHRGSDYAATLNRVLKLVGITGLASSREYIDDLKRGSMSAQLINEEFEIYANTLPIYSFFETLETSFGLSSSLVVDRDSAVLGPAFKGESSRYMNANHRDVCKFENPNDPNYISLKNTIATAVQDLLLDVLSSNEKESKAQLQSIQTFLGVSDLPEEHHEKFQGSCQWIDEREDFQDWREAPYEVDTKKDLQYSPSIYWINAGPGVGKTVLAAHVSSQLEEIRLQHAAYFFHSEDQSSQLSSSLLRSIAYQMAKSTAAVRNAMVSLHNEGVVYDHDDARAVWAKIFRAGILQIPLHTPYYWVIDAVDECLKYAEIFTLLKAVRCRFPLRIFLTSRKLPDMSKIARQLEGSAMSIVEIPLSDTMKDIELFVRNRIEFLPIDNDSEKEKVTEEILAKSDACFLWVRLVMDELERVYAYESMMSVLQEMPKGMMAYYQRATTDMARNKREKHISKSILAWVMSAARPLSISELSEALQLDINVHLPGAMAAVEGLCGYLVSIDKNTEFVSIIHATAREFLLSDIAGEFKISSSESHERIALTSLQLLISPRMQPPRHRNLVNKLCSEQQSSPLLEYAVFQFSEHLYGACSVSDKLLIALHRFLSTTVLSWIERIAAKGVLHRLTRVARNLRGYLDGRAKYPSTLGSYIKVVESWTTDLSRLVTKFVAALTAQPLSIYFLIPPLCPTETAIYRQFGQTPDGLIRSGFSYTHWDDCVATIKFENESPAAIACDNDLIAVGYMSGNIHLYNHGTLQTEQVIEHDSPVDRLLVDPLGSFIALASIKYLTVWDLKGKMLWKNRVRSRFIFLTCSLSFIIGITPSGNAFRWDIATGEQLGERRYPYPPLELDQGSRWNLSKVPFAASVTPGLELLALAYPSGPISIYDLETGIFLSWAVERNSRRVSYLVFNPNPEVNLLLVAYDDSHLALYDTWSGAPVRDQSSQTRTLFTSLSCSPDGRRFGVVDVPGALQIRDFESLAVLYQILIPQQSFHVLSFTSDSSSLVEVTEKEMRIWSPSVLIRKTVEEGFTVGEQAAFLPSTKGLLESTQSSRLRSTIAHHIHRVVFAGNRDGDVVVFNSDNGHEMGILYSHKNAVVNWLALTGNAIASGDINARVQVRCLDTTGPGGVKADRLLFRASFPAAIYQLLFDAAGEHLLVSTREADYVYNVATGTLVGSLSFSERVIWKWIALPSPTCGNRFMLLCDRKLEMYLASTFPSVLSECHVSLNYNVEDGMDEIGIDSAIIHPDTMSLIIEVRQRLGCLTPSAVLIFNLPSFEDAADVDIEPVKILSKDVCRHLLGIGNPSRKLFFLHKASWVCSIDLTVLETPQYTQHFFVPSEFIIDSDNVRPIQTSINDFVFTLYDKLAIIKNGLKFQETKSLIPTL
ncbi:NACHT and WD domain protein [Thozetella sp. PMI_491]|nr:NACHT and WD domain protein [Thozetella sp. PMI_491]